MRNFCLWSLILLGLMITSDVNAQKALWAYSTGSTLDQMGNDLAVDKDNNVIVVGQIKGANIDLDPSSSGSKIVSSAGDNDVFVAKYNSVGQFLWGFSFGAVGNDAAVNVALDTSGNIYISGWFRNSVDFDPGSGSAVLVSNGHSGNDGGYGGDAFLAKYSASGDYQWAISAGGPHILDFGDEVLIDNNGDVLWTGGFYGTVDFNPSGTTNNLVAKGINESFLAKYSSTGQYIWAVRFGDTTVINSGGRGLAVDKNNNIYFTGHFDGTIDQDPGPGTHLRTSNGCGDIQIIKLRPNSDFVWGHNIGGSNCDYVWDMAIDTNANIYVTGLFASVNTDFNPGSGVNMLTPKGGSDSYILKLDSSGTYVYARSFGSLGEDMSLGLAIQSNKIYLLGAFTGTLNFSGNPGAGNTVMTSAGMNDFYLVGFSLDGNFETAYRIGGANDDYGRGIGTTADGEVYLTGYYKSTNVDFDPSSSKLTMSTQGGFDFFVAKYTNLNLFNTLKGSVFLDRNNNGTKDAGESYYNGAKIISIKENQDTIVTFTSAGRYSYSVDTGQYITRSIPYLPYHTVSTAPDTTTFTTYFNSDSASFAVQPIPGIKDLMIAAFPLTPARPGFAVLYKLYYYNRGTDTISTGSVQFIRDSRLIFDSASVTPASINTDTINWNITSFKPGEIGSLILYLRVVTPPSISIGDTLLSKATIYPVASDSTPSNNVFRLKQLVIGSYDPNDKQESHAGRITTTQIGEGEYLQYTIRFQNTGTDTAFNVNVRDTLSAKLDWSTLEMVTASHEYQLTVTDGNKLYWNFANINLVDSNENERLSHGHIVFRIKPKADLVPGDIITNKASIYFDYNIPVVTNVEQTIVEIPSVLPLRMLEFSARRAGKANELNWVAVNEVNVSHHEIQRSGDGHDFTAIGTVTAQTGTGEKHYSFTDVLPLKATNYYRLRIVDKDGKIQFSPIRKVENRLNLFVEASPNPVSDKLVVRVSSENTKQVQLEVIDINGRTFSRQNVSLNNGYRTVELNIAYLSSGSYFIRVSAGEEQLTQKFIKL